jgi:hypothetical protein
MEIYLQPELISYQDGGWAAVIENRVYRKGSYILAEALAMDNSTVGAAIRLFCGFFLK